MSRHAGEYIPSQFFLAQNGEKTFQHDKHLPALPVPNLDSTLDKYLDSGRMLAINYFTNYFTIISLVGGDFTLTSLVDGYLTIISLVVSQILNCDLMVNQWHKSVKTQHTVRKCNKYEKEMIFFIHSYRLQVGHLSCH